MREQCLKPDWGEAVKRGPDPVDRAIAPTGGNREQHQPDRPPSSSGELAGSSGQGGRYRPAPQRAESAELSELGVSTGDTS